MRRHIKYLWYVLRHKWFVFWAGFGTVSIWQLLIHDWDKFRRDEWLPYARTFYAPDGSNQYDNTPEFAMAWMKHQHRNKHHWQWWLNAGDTPLSNTNILVWDHGGASIIIDGEVYPWEDGVFPWEENRKISVREAIPEKYLNEMIADWVGAGRALGKPEAWVWYEENKDKMKLHPETRKKIETRMRLLKRSYVKPLSVL